MSRMNIPDILYALHEDIITRDEARRLIDALAHMELSVGLVSTRMTPCPRCNGTGRIPPIKRWLHDSASAKTSRHSSW